MLYMCYINLNKDNAVGVRKKIKAQCCAFRKVFGTVYYTIFDGHTFYLLSGDEIIEKRFALTKKMCNDIALKWVSKFDIKRVYIRYDFSDIWFLDFLQELKIGCIKVVLEFPSIPYDDERGCTRPTEDRYYREQLCQYVNCCTTYANYQTVFNIPCITLVNGVDVNENKSKRYREKDDSIILVAVAIMAKWHGYERVIQGMYEYYSKGGKTNIIFKLVGDGGQIPYYNSLAVKYGLQNHVIFCGRLDGKDLDDVYDESDIAIGVLGMYKVGRKSAAPIKSGEYCARGIPFVYGYDDVSIGSNKYFAYQVSNDATPVNIDAIIEFYNNMYNGRDFITDMRKYAIENLIWDKVLEPIVNYFALEEKKSE